MAPALTLHVLPRLYPCLGAEAAFRLKGLEVETVSLAPGTHHRSASCAALCVVAPRPARHVAGRRRATR